MLEAGGKRALKGVKDSSTCVREKAERGEVVRGFD